VTAGTTVVTVHDFVSSGEGLTDDHLALRDSVRGFLAQHLPLDELVNRVDAGVTFDRALWRTLASDLGLHGLAVPEDLGGSGYTWIEQALVFQEMGRALYDGPYWSTVGMAIPILLACGDVGAQQRWVPALVDGSSVAAVCATRPGAVQVVGQGAEVSLTGQVTPVIAGVDADLLILSLGDAGQRSLYAVELASVSRTPLETLDLTRSVAGLELNETPAVLVGDLGKGDESFAVGSRFGRLALSAEQVGGAEVALEMAVSYAKVREQFGRPIGSFQAIKHSCSSMLLELESSRALLEHSAWLAACRPEYLEAAAAACGAKCSEAFSSIAYDALHIHGGLGFTWEHPGHLYFRRARSDELMMGGVDECRAALADWICG
jgi:alkylation response protein AidB-like acyl-CoA dehydrogenase